MTIHEVLNILKNKDFHDAPSSKKLTSAEQLIKEAEWTDILQNLIDMGNIHLLKNFQYRLIMDDDVKEEEEK